MSDDLDLGGIRARVEARYGRAIAKHPDLVDFPATPVNPYLADAIERGQDA